MTALSTTTMKTVANRRYGPSKFQLQMDEARDAAEFTFKCAVDGCTMKPWTGPAGEARLVAAEHRKTEHGWKPKKRRKR